MLLDDLRNDAALLVDQLLDRHLKVATAESCTGGLVSSMLTEVPGSSRALDRGFVTYTNEAKTEMLGVNRELVTRLGAVSREVAIAMAEGALGRSRADLAVSVTGLAGPGGGTETKPVGLVHIAAANRQGPTLHEEWRFGDISRSDIRHAAAAAAFQLLRRAAGIVGVT